MNCQELTQLLDDGDIHNLPVAQRQELDAHLSGCADCAAEWRVQERINMTPKFQVPVGFVAQCRRLVAASTPRKMRSRVILYSTVLVVAAAAAILAWRMRAAPESAAVVAAVPVIVAPVQASPQVQPKLAPTPEPAKPQPAASHAGGFTVAVPPLQIEGTDTEGNAKAERFRERVMALLQAVPNLLLMDGAETVAADYEVRMKYTGATTPTTRMVRLEIVEPAEFAATAAAIAAEAGMSPAEQQRSQLERDLARARAKTQKLIASVRNGNVGLSGLLGSPSPIVAIIDDISPLPGDRMENAAQQLVGELRVKIFPLDESFEQELLAILANPAQGQGLRVRALAALLNYAERRGGFSHTSPAAVRAGGELALIREPLIEAERPTIWDALALTASPELVPYLIRGLNEAPLTETRLQMVKILAEVYGDDPRALAALAAATKSNDQQTVRMAALRESGSSQWSEYVVATLNNPTLTPLQRLQPIADMAPGNSATVGTSPKSELMLEDQQLRELASLVVKLAPDTSASEIVRKTLFAAGAMDTPAALDMLVGIMDSLHTEDLQPGMERVSVMSVRSAATNLIGFRYASNPKSRAVIEKLAKSGDAMERLLAEILLGSMDSKSSAEKARQNQPPAQ